MSDNALPNARKGSIWTLLLILIALAASAAAGYAWWLQQQGGQGQDVATAKPAVEPNPVFMPLETFTVNLITPDNSLDRVLYIGFTLRLPDEATRRKLNEFLPEVRSRLLMLLARQTAESLIDEAGKQRLIGEIKQVLTPPLVKNQPDQMISDVLFTAFILR